MKKAKLNAALEQADLFTLEHAVMGDTSEFASDDAMLAELLAEFPDDPDTVLVESAPGDLDDAAVEAIAAADVEIAAAEPEIDAELAELMGEVEAAPVAVKAMIEAAVPEAAAAPVTDELLEDAVFAAEVEEQKQELYAEQEAGGEMLEEPAAPVAAVEADKPAAEKKKGGFKREPREYLTKHSDKIAKKLGESAADFAVLTPADAEKSEEERKVMMAELMKGVDTLPVKAGNKARLLFQFLKEGGKLNEYLRRAFVCFARDGYVETTKEGNYVSYMTAPTDGLKPLGLKTALSQCSQFNALMPFLKIATKEKGRLVLNPDSMIYLTVKASLGL